MNNFGMKYFSKLHRGFSQITVAIAVALVAILIIGASIASRHPSSIGQYAEQGVSVPRWDVKGIEATSIAMPILGTVQLSDGSFSAFKLRSAQIINGGYGNEVRYYYPNGDDGLGINNGKIANFYTAEGKVFSANLIEPAIVAIVLPDGREYPARILAGHIDQGDLVDSVRIQLYSPNLVFTAQIITRKDGQIGLSNITLLGEGERISDTAYTLAKQTIAFRKKIAWGDSTKIAQVLGVSDTKSYFYDDLASVDFDATSSSWRIGGAVPGLSAAPIIKSIDPSVKVSYENGVVQISLAPSIVNNNIFNTTTVVDKSLTGLDIADASITTLQLASSNAASPAFSTAMGSGRRSRRHGVTFRPSIWCSSCLARRAS